LIEEVRFLRNPDFIFRKIVDELILVPIHQDLVDMECIFTLNEVGAFLWENLQEPHSFSELKDLVLDTYAADPQTVESDVQAFINEMRSIGSLGEV